MRSMPEAKWVKRTSGLFWWWEWMDTRSGVTYQCFADVPTTLAFYIFEVRWEAMAV